MLQDEELDLRDYLYALRRRKWIAMTIFFLIVISVTIFSFLQTPVYQATARLLIDAERPKVLTFQEVLSEDTTNTAYYQTQYELLKSPTLVKQVLEKLGIMERALQEQPQKKLFTITTWITELQNHLGLRQSAPSSEKIDVVLKEKRIIRKFLKNIRITSVKGDRLLDIIVTSPENQEAVQIANTLAEMYIERNLENKLSASKKAVQWLEKELETILKKMKDSEIALQAYEEQNAIIAFNDRQNIVMQKLSQFNTAVNEAKIKRIAINAQYRQVQKYLHSGAVEELESIPQVIHSSLIQHLKIELSSLESEFSELLKKFRSKHPNVIALQSQITSVQERINAEINRIVRSIMNEYDVVRTEEEELLASLEQQKKEILDLNEKALTYELLKREVESNQRIYDALLQRAKEANITKRLETSSIRIVDRATTPDQPIAPRKTRNILFAGIFGLFMGIMVVLFLEYWDMRIKTPKDIKQYLHISCLGSIPKISVKGLVPRTERQSAMDVIIATIVLVAPRTIVSEAYRGLRTNLMCSSHEQGFVLLITSSAPEEGKSGLVANLGIAMALSGQKTLIIDCDFRKPVMHHIFHLKNSQEGFSNLIKNAENPGTKRVIQHTDIHNLYVLPCGEIPPNPSELLESTLTRRYLETLRNEYDKILIDSPPVNMVTDPVILSRIVNGVLLIIRAGKTKRDAVQCARDQLRDAGATIIGGVLNNVDIRKDNHYYGYHFSQYYQDEEQDMVRM